MLTDSATGCQVVNYPGSKTDDSVTWSGPCVDGKATGNGHVQWLRAGVLIEQYDGDYSAGRPHGKGRFRDENGFIYEGEWRDGIRSGQGTFTTPTFRYEGQFENDTFGGIGRVSAGRGSVTGKFVGMKIVGDATVQFANGDTFVGSLSNWVPDHGTLTKSDGSVLTGDFRDGELEGYGTLSQQDVSYKGNFSKGVMSGHGVISKKDDFALEGEFADGEPKGLAKIRWRNGDVLETEFRNKKPDGLATLTAASGELRTYRFDGGVPTLISGAKSDAADALISILTGIIQVAAARSSAGRSIQTDHASASSRLYSAASSVGRDPENSHVAAASLSSSPGSRSEKLHDPLAVAHQCLSIDSTDSLYGGFKNSCNEKVSYGYCVLHPKKGGWTDSPAFDCEGNMARGGEYGGLSVGPMARDVEHTRGGERVIWFACTHGATPQELQFNGTGISGKCIH